MRSKYFNTKITSFFQTSKEKVVKKCHEMIYNIKWAK